MDPMAFEQHAVWTDSPAITRREQISMVHYCKINSSGCRNSVDDLIIQSVLLISASAGPNRGISCLLCQDRCTQKFSGSRYLKRVVERTIAQLPPPFRIAL